MVKSKMSTSGAGVFDTGGFGASVFSNREEAFSELHRRLGRNNTAAVGYRNKVIDNKNGRSREETRAAKNALTEYIGDTDGLRNSINDARQGVNDLSENAARKLYQSFEGDVSENDRRLSRLEKNYRLRGTYW